MARAEDRRPAGARPDVPRLFIAVPVPAAVGALVGAVIDTARGELGDDARRIRWVQLDGLHLTLRFLGPTAADWIPAAGAAIDRAAHGLARFEVRLAGAGAFPSLDRPRALWLGIRSGADALAALTERIESELRAAGWTMETRPFRPHLTIARTDGVRIGPAAAAALERAAGDLDARFEAATAVLFRSHLGRGPARYERLHEAPLG